MPRKTLEKAPYKETHLYYNPPPTKKELEQKEAAYKKACEEARKKGQGLPAKDDPGNTDLLEDYDPKAKKPHLYYITYKKVQYKVMADKDWELGDGKRTQCTLSWAVGMDGKPVLYLEDVKQKK